MKFVWALAFVVESLASLVILYWIFKANHLGVSTLLMVFFIMGVWAMAESYRKLRMYEKLGQ